ncbi:hypothetical protein ACQUFY_08275 [Robbsia andropogonis]|uniref:hypothetical protein n=1 Tax=Robbsia andropogonis TaxID=28092 RepID=UPI003D1CA1C4
MGQKHHKRTRAEILSKRAKPIVEVPVVQFVPLTGPHIVIPFKRVTGRSKYSPPHFGAKQAHKLATRRGW